MIRSRRIREELAECFRAMFTNEKKKKRKKVSKKESKKERVLTPLVLSMTIIFKLESIEYTCLERH